MTLSSRLASARMLLHLLTCGYVHHPEISECSNYFRLLRHSGPLAGPPAARRRLRLLLPRPCEQALIVSDGPRWTTPLNVRRDERADRAVITSAPETHMAMVVLTWLHLFSLEEVAGWDIKPAGTCLHQLVAGDGKAIHIAAAGKGIPRMR